MKYFNNKKLGKREFYLMNKLPVHVFLTKIVLSREGDRSWSSPVLDMCLLTYFRRKDQLPDPNDPLSRSFPSQTIIAANQEVETALKEKSSKSSIQSNLVNLLYWWPMIHLNHVAS